MLLTVERSLTGAVLFLSPWGGIKRGFLQIIEEENLINEVNTTCCLEGVPETSNIP